MSLISAHGIKKTYGPRLVLDQVSLTLDDGDRLGLIGINGAGKSTLVRILVGQEDADAGEIQRKRGLSVGYVTQSPKLDPEATVLAVVEGGLARNLDLRKRLEGIGAAIEASSGTDLDQLVAEQAALTDALEHAGGWNIEHKAEAAMQALQVPPKDRIIGQLSEGERRRVAICAALLASPDLLVLDEPTNHIDVETIEWLEGALASYPGALILVTHDRWFLDRVANRHAELDRGELRLYEGNYSEYLAAKAERDALEARVEHKRRRAIENELQWVRRKAPARTTKQRARLERFDALVAARPKTVAGEATFRLPHPPRTGKTILELHGVSKSIAGKKLVEKLDLILKKGDRLGIVGPNGIGKTTLLRMIKGEIEPDAGEIVLGQNTELAYADQRRPLDDRNTVLEEVAGDNDVVFVGDESMSVHAFLDGLLFDGAQQRTVISALSGGERSRVALAKALRVRANLLVLDEPTNDLDLPTLRVIEDALLDYPGCALIVSHDRYFLERVTTAILAFEGDGKVVLYEGSYESWRARMAERAAEAEAAAASEKREAEKREAEKAPKAADKPATAASASAASGAAKPKKLSFKDQRELDGIEAKILEAEAKVADLEAELSDPERLRALGAGTKAKLAELDTAKREVERLYERWAELGA
ncbi:ATP-binding cassette domain-containing protein [Myxococcota bacterium]|nr:ATP-binding cassette domain-containing protein [Myxococcota bacterium]